MTPPNPSFLLLLRHPNGPKPANLGEIMTRFGVWMQGLKEQGLLVGTQGLDNTGAVLRQPGGVSVSDGPYIEAKEMVGGFIIITARDLAHAIATAKGCPGLDYGVVLEVRPIATRPPE